MSRYAIRRRDDHLFFVFFFDFATTFFVFATTFFFRATFAFFFFLLEGAGRISSSAANSRTPSCEPVAATLPASTRLLTASPIGPKIPRDFFFYFAISPTPIFQKYRVTSDSARRTDSYSVIGHCSSFNAAGYASGLTGASPVMTKS